MAEFMRRQAGKVENLQADSEDGTFGGMADLSTTLADCNVVTSRAVNNFSILEYHMPVLDLDFEARLIPSSRPDHFHLYLDRAMTWDNYVKLLTVLEEVGIIEPGYLNASLKRGYSTVRLPWHKKPGVRHEGAENNWRPFPEPLPELVKYAAPQPIPFDQEAPY